MQRVHEQVRNGWVLTSLGVDAVSFAGVTVYGTQAHVRNESPCYACHDLRCAGQLNVSRSGFSELHSCTNVAQAG